MISDHQLHLLHHTLGLRPDRRDSYRNYFVAGAGHLDQPDLESLVAAGLMKRQKSPRFLESGDEVFSATDAGLQYAIDHLPQPEPQRNRGLYDEYLAAEPACSFGEFICGRKLPRWECRISNGKWECRMFRRDPYGATEVTGEWCKTKKEAKASYKAKLKEYRDFHREQAAA